MRSRNGQKDKLWNHPDTRVCKREMSSLAEALKCITFNRVEGYVSTGAHVRRRAVMG